MADHEKHIDDLLKGALGNYAEVPPAGAWADMQSRLENADGATHIDDVLADALGNYAEVPPVGAWADMEARLDEKKSRRRPFIWLWYAAAVSGVLLLAYLFVDKRESDTAFRGKGVAEEVAKQSVKDHSPVDAAPALSPQEELVKKTQDAPPTHVPAKKEALKTTETTANKESVPTYPQEKIETAQPIKETTPPQKTAPIAQENSTEPVINDVPKNEKQVKGNAPVPQGAVVATKDKESEPEEIDDIAHAIKKRGPGTVMNVIRSRYADSMEKVEKELVRLAEERKAQEAAKEEARRSQPPVAATSKAPVEAVKEETKTPVATIDPMAQRAIDKTEKNLVARQDAIPGSGIKQPVDEIRFEDSDSFIGPRQDTYTYASTFAAVDDSLPGAFVRIKTPLTFDLFMKLGLETGTSKYTASKYVFAPMLQANFSDKLSLIFQPALKGGNVNFSSLSKEQSYYSIENSYMDSTKSYTKGHNAQGIIFDSVKASYYYKESYDSVVISHELNNTRVIEAELPLMLNYKVAKGLSLYGGPVVTFSNMLQVDEKRNNYSAGTRRDTITYAVSEASEAPYATPIREVFTYDGTNISEYTPAPYANPSVNKVRFGYMLGVSYSYKRLSADLSVQQNISRLDYIPNIRVRNTYMQPYARFMIGYRINNRKK